MSNRPDAVGGPFPRLSLAPPLYTSSPPLRSPDEHPNTYILRARSILAMPLPRSALWTAALLGLVAIGLVAGTASAATGEGSFAGPGWVGLEALDGDGTGSFELTVQGSELPLHAGVALYDGQRVPFSVAGVVIEDFGSRTHVRAEAGEATLVDVEDGGVQPFFPRFTVQVSWDLATDDVVLLAWTAGDVLDTAWSLDAGEGASIGETTSGSETFLRWNNELGSGIEHREDGNRTRATIARETVTVDRGLVGLFTRGEDAAGPMVADTPEGRERCPCGFTGHRGPGTYTFTSADGGTGEAALLLGGADADLP